MIFGLTTGHEIGLVVTAVVFISYALVSALVLPRRYPNFPGRYRRPYLAVTVVIFLAMIGAVVVFAKEKTDTSLGVAPPSAPKALSAVAAIGDPVAGKVIFKSATCNTCHTFKPAGSTATIGPDLDHLAEYAKKVHYDLAYFIRAAIVVPPAPYVPPGYPTAGMPIDYGHSLSQTDIDNVIAFLYQGNTSG
jgi:cytochrome c551/c552